MINILKTNVQKFTHIFHVADIHIRLNKRHEEYREVFNQLYAEINNSPPETVVALLGDVFHSKSDLSPECIQMASDLFSNIANIRPLILVAGNHDATLSNKSRLDSLTPIVDALNNPNIYYLKTTGLYGFGNILWNNMCVFDDPDKYLRGQDIPDIYKNQYDHVIALFHGAVDKASLETGYSISNPAIMNPLFDYNDIALLGDIHKKQDMQDYSPEEHKPCIHYVGSMVQQNHGEGMDGHGYSLWDLKTRMYDFKELKNDYGYFTVDIHKGVLTSDIKNLPKKVRLRVKCFETIASEVKTIIAMIKGISQVVEIAYLRMDQETDDKKDVIPLCKDIVLTDLTNTDYQNRLISEFLQKKSKVTDPLVIDEILGINRKANALIKRDEFARNLKWKPIRFEWDNMFTYGEGNSIDFTQMDGVYGIFGPNKSGKSSILSAIIFCLFDKFDRGFKGLHVLNVQKTSFKCKLEFEISGVRYFIERVGSTTRSGNVKVDVKFWKLVNGVEEDLHGTARRDTNDIIRDYIGTYEDFVLTAASFQNAKNNSSFIDMGNSERKDLLVQFIGLNVFDRLHEAAGERNKELNAILKLHKDKNYPHEIQQNRNALEHAVSLFTITNTETENLKKQIAEVNEQIVIETSNLIKLDEGVPTNLVALEERKSSAETVVRQKKQALEGYRTSLTQREKVLSELDEAIKKIEESNLVESHKIYKTLLERINETKQKIDLKKIEVRGKLEKTERLKNHEYDPNCKYCTNNSFVKDATQAQKELIEDKKDADKLVGVLENLRGEFSKVQWVEEVYEKYTKLLTDKSKIKDEHSSFSRNIIISTNELEKLEASCKLVIQQVELYHRNKVSVEANEKVHAKISSYRNALTRLDVEFQKHHRSLMDISGKMALFKSQIDTLTQLMEEVTALENEFTAYQHYMEAVGRDGIPYQVICNTVPEIEREVNSILSQVVDYTVQFETDGKNIVPYVVYEYGRWPIELTSGYERFVASVAVRVALTNISNLPKTTFLAIDEGFGTLDGDNLASMYTLFSFLKNNFDFILVISHLDALKDAVDKTIELVREGNLTKVTYE
jgi:DNA repair exonuclease SbcCD ATPase subunit